MRDAGRAIRRYEDWKPEMVRIADRAADDGRLLNASIYCRSAEFYALPQDSDRKLLYDRFRDLFNAAFQGEEIEYRWERPTAAVLDHFNLDDVTLFGLSMGGWFCLRAAAFEPRVKRVVASGGAIDYLEIVPAAIRWMFTL